MTTNNNVNYQPTQYNVLTGNASNALNNIAPSSTSGVPLISQGSSSQPTFGTAVVAGGGTGVTSATAYGVICGGTTSTGSLQALSSLGNQFNVLLSNGASTLPSFQNVKSKVFYTLATGAGDPVDGTTYYMSVNTKLFTSTTSNGRELRIFMPYAGTINTVYGAITVQGTLGSTENCTVFMSNIDTNENKTNTNITTTLKLNAASNTFNATSLGISVSRGYAIALGFTGPTWATNPTTVSFSCCFMVE